MRCLLASLSLFRTTYRLARRRPLPVLITAAAATILTLVGVLATAAPATAAVSKPDPIIQAGTGLLEGQAGTFSFADIMRAPSVAPATRHASPASPKHSPATRPATAPKKSAPKDQPRHRAAPQRPAAHHKAAGGHPATHRHAATHRPTPHHASSPAPRRPYLIYDSITPPSIPSHHMVAAYATGRYAASPAAVAGRGPVLWIDTFGGDPKASVLDVEPGDATPSVAAAWARHRLTDDPNAIAHLYTMRSEWPAVQAAVATLPAHMRSHIRWWIADPTGHPHVVPGASATQWYWGPHYDITTANPDF